MPDSRTHRGPHPKDPKLFAPDQWDRLRAATAELSWLLSRGYKSPPALELVGDRHALTRRQRQAVSGAACPDEVRERRLRQLVAEESLDELWIDGFNVLVTVEVALGGGPVFAARDGALRDVASVHGTYRKVYETEPAVVLLTEELLRRKVERVRLLLDAPVSNSGRLARLIEEQWKAEVPGRDWRVLLVRHPDEDLVRCGQVVASADGVVVDRARGWLSLARDVVERSVPKPFWVDLMV